LLRAWRRHALRGRINGLLSGRSVIPGTDQQRPELGGITVADRSTGTGKEAADGKGPVSREAEAATQPSRSQPTAGGISTFQSGASTRPHRLLSAEQ